jgi:hypothetical protein
MLILFIVLLCLGVILLSLRVGLFNIPGWLLKHRMALIVIVILIVGFAAYRTINKPKPDTLSTIQIPYYQQIEPPLSNASQVIQTVSPDRVYYVASYTDDGRVVTLNKYYFYNKKRWEQGTYPLPLDKNNYKEIRIYNR